MIVAELIKQLQEMPQDLPVYYVMFDDGYNMKEISDTDVVITELEDDDGKEVYGVVFGEGWLL